jgi:hypothetical protein
MPEARTPNSDFNRAFGDAKKQAAGVAGEVSDAAQDLYGQAADSASQEKAGEIHARYDIAVAATPDSKVDTVGGIPLHFECAALGERRIPFEPS